MTGDATRRRAMIIIGGVLYGAAVFAVFLYLTFPVQQLAARLLSEAESWFSLRIAAQEADLQFPATLLFREVTLQRPSGPARTLLTVRTLRFEPSLLSVVRGGVVTGLDLATSGWRWTGSLSMKRGGQAGHQYQLSGKGGNLDTSQVFHLDGPASLEGKITIVTENEWEGRDILKGVGTTVLEATGLRLKGFEIMGIHPPPLDFTTVTGRLSLRRGMVTLEEFRAEGEEADVTGNGSLLLRTPMQETLINVSFQVVLKQGGEFLTAFPFPLKPEEPFRISIRGTLQRPQYYFNDISLNRPTLTS